MIVLRSSLTEQYLDLSGSWAPWQDALLGVAIGVGQTGVVGHVGHQPWLHRLSAHHLDLLLLPSYLILQRGAADL